MRNATGIRIEQAIVHILDNKSPKGLILSDHPLPLDEQPELAQYLAGHLENSLKDSRLEAARFVDGDSGTAADFQALLKPGADLVQGSRRLAQNLHAIMSTNQAIASGDLVVCLFTAQTDPPVERIAGVLKVDPGQAYRHEAKKDKHGDTTVTLRREGDILPSTRERLQKCAFVQPPDAKAEYDLMILDPQAHQTANVVARFFRDGFLKAQPALDSRTRTERLYKSLVVARNTLQPELSPDEYRGFEQSVDAAIRGSFIDLPQWIESLPIKPPQKKVVRELVFGRLPDTSFALDEGYVQQLMRKRLFRGSDDLRVEISAGAYDEMVRVELVNEPDRPAHYLVTIRTDSWREVPR